jgi:hypothetical protein
MARPLAKHSTTDEVRLLGNITSMLRGVAGILLSTTAPKPIQLAAAEVSS